jgi:hypothetical protein
MNIHGSLPFDIENQRYFMLQANIDGFGYDLIKLGVCIK